MEDRMKIGQIISIALLFFIISAMMAQAQMPQASSQRKPNIIFIMADDHGYQAISAYNNKLIQTPNIDRIGREGAVMRNAFVTNSVCSPSRAVILTGKYSHANGMRDNGTYFNGSQETLPKILKTHGYRTAIVGKWHLFSEPTGFDYWNILPDQGNYYNPKFIKMGKDTTYTGYVTDVTTDLALNWIEKNQSQPFFMMLHHKAPHRNWMPSQQYLTEFNDRHFPLPHDFYDDYKGREGLQRQLISMKEGLDVRYDSKVPCDTCAITQVNDWAPAEFQREMERLTPAEREAWDKAYADEYKTFLQIKEKDKLLRWQYQRFLEDYLRCVHSVDDNVGRVLKYLDDKGLVENTIVVYMSDQGVYLGEHGLYDKRFMYEESFRTPMLIRYPKVIPAVQQVDAYVLNLDVAPTFLDLADISIPKDIQGKSMKTLLAKGKATDWRKEVYYHYYEKSFGATAHYGIRTKRYKLIHFYDPVNSWELYDLKKDPNEMHNLYNEPSSKDVIVKLKGQLKSLQKKYNDQYDEKNNKFLD
ncbi:sulfatase family protein [Chryseosolibacter indicus]|uniref:Sulfatase n=1 Tax=Chryseosolibacter indicus TaxID=2782351 RepID=A0ABS5VYM2_9BACT|nr:sulfatase [Chryseosolibacter indicus]MBT1706509.1 sulfatase [Chryseosolibacter indicus]